MIIRLKDGIPEIYSIEELKEDNPNVSFPSEIPERILNEFQVYTAVQADRPAEDNTKDIVEGDITLIDGVWTQTWNEISLSAEEIKVRTNERARQSRSMEYGSIGDQLDMIYWDMVNGTTLWKDHIERIKATYPKID